MKCDLCGQEIHPQAWKRGEAVFCVAVYPCHLFCYLSGIFTIQKTIWIIKALRSKDEGKSRGKAIS